MSVVLLSPHLDDAIMSLGGTMHLLGRLGVPMRIVTIFAGDPCRAGRPSFWDVKRGSATAAETFAARRAEDAAAAAVLGAETVWLPFDDDSYEPKRDDDEVWSALEPHLRGADAVLVPGSPLTHPDHRYTSMLALDRLDGAIPLGFYAEQPYSSRPRYLAGFLRGATAPLLRAAVGEDLVWDNINLDPASRAAKRAAVVCYEGELATLGYRVHLDALVARALPRERIAHRSRQPLPSFLAGTR